MTPDSDIDIEVMFDSSHHVSESETRDIIVSAWPSDFPHLEI